MNNEPKHTPGPWTMDYESGQYFFLEGPDQHPLMRQRGGMMPTRHDARLIAAAPELLAACKSLLLYVETYGGEVTANIEAAFPIYRAAIAKAEGKS
jgi:hypothetical protein